MKISVIAIFYKSAPYVKKCIDSVLSQKMVNGIELELIAVNDCSPDETLSILRSYEDNRLNIVSHEKNKGISAARNTGLSHVTGDCFFFIDGDDFLPENALATLASYYESDVDWVSGAYAMCDHNGEVKRINRHGFCDSRTRDAVMRDFGYHEFIYTHNKLINSRHKDIRFPIGKAHEDRFWNVEVFGRLQHIVNIEEPTYCYIMRPTSFSSQSRATLMYVDSAVQLLKLMQELPHCWNILKWTFLITAVEKNLYLWKWECSYRKKVLRDIKPMVLQCNLNIEGFPRFTKLIHKMIKAGFPDSVIEAISRNYRYVSTLLKRPV